MSIIVTFGVKGGLIEGKMCGVWKMIKHLLPTGSEGEGSIGSWEYSCCNTSLLSVYERYYIIITDMNIVG